MNGSRRPARSVFSLFALWGLAVVLVSPASAARAAEQESWDAIYMAGSKVGHVHIFVEPVNDKGRKLLRVRVDTVLNFRRDKDLVTNKLQYGTIETLDGSVLRLDTRTLTSDGEIRAYGDVVDGEMNLILQSGGTRQEKVLKWSPDVRGPYAAEMTLAREPIKPGESRDLKMFVPDLNRICDITLTAKQKEEVLLGDGEKHALLRIEETTKLDGKARREFDTTLWVDSAGQVIKSSQDVLGGMVVYRTTKEGALAADRGMAVDRIAHSVIKVANKIPNSTAVRAIRYRVELPGDDLSQLLPNDRRQTLTTEGESKSSGTLNVKTAGPEVGEAESGEVSPQFLRPNALVTSEDSQVQALTRRAVGDTQGAWEKAVKIERFVFQNLKDKNFATTFAPASEVARTLSGDCTEHSVLAAAMSRAAGLPSRVAIGLVYADHLGGFGFHMWHEVHVTGRWVALDASFDESAVDATHIKLSDTSLDGVAPFEAFLPIVRVMGKLSIVPLEVR
ncbi:MAG: transglutaminase domain-containing protein [Isosphaeraceae bacterium]|nr:transglutaminase domain-containing protein [Isosphaeraceae bacterium]